MKKTMILQLLTAAALLASSCRREQYAAPAISGVKADTIVLNIGDRTVLAPNITNLKGNSYTWLLNGKEINAGQVNYTFEATAPGNYTVVFKAGNKGGAAEQTFSILVEKVIAITMADQLAVPQSQVLDIIPTITGPERNDYRYEWSIGDSVIGRNLNLHFISPSSGTFELKLRATAGKQTVVFNRTITVEPRQYVNNACTVLEYLPSPGKNHNWSIIGNANNWRYGSEYPLAYSNFLAKASELRKTNANNGLFLGSWGGSATFKFDHTVANAAGKADVEIAAYYSIRDIPEVHVAYDRNKNGKPDEEEWYVIRNDDYGQEDIPAYEITFTYDRTEKDDKRIYTYFNWKDNLPENAQGEILTNKTFSSAMTNAGAFSVRGFFPGLAMTDLAAKEVAILDGWKNTFSRKGKRITRNLTGVVTFLQKLNIDIDMAVDSKGVSVQLPGIDFVKVRKVVYPMQQEPAPGTAIKDFNMEEGRMLQVTAILDKHFTN